MGIPHLLRLQKDLVTQRSYFSLIRSPQYRRSGRLLKFWMPNGCRISRARLVARRLQQPMIVADHSLPETPASWTTGMAS
jgi:hypothetical protein